jgi:ribosome production factor 2
VKLNFFSSRKPKTRKGRKALINREPKTKEDGKNTLFIEGRKCSGNIKTALKDLYHLRKPQCVVMQHNNDISPFEDASKIEL